MEDFDLIETPENVELQRRLAGLGSRFTAGVLDTVYMSLIYLALFLTAVLAGGFDLLTDLEENGPDGWAIAALALVAFAVYWFYFAFFEMVMNGQSPGKRSVQIRVVKDGGGAITFMDVAIRNLLRAVDCLAFYGVGGACMFATRKMQRLGDLAAGTIVVSEQLHDYRARTDKRGRTEWHEEMQPEVFRDSGLSAAEYRMLANYWSRRAELSIEARKELVPRLVLPILRRMGRTVPDESPAALERIVGDWLEKTDSARPVAPSHHADEAEQTS